MSRYLFYIAVASVVIVPLAAFIPLPGTDIWYVEFLALFFMLMLAVSVSLWKFNKWLAMLSLLALCSVILQPTQNPRAIICLTQLNLCLLATMLMSRFSRKQRKALLAALFVTFVIQTVMMTLQYFNLDPVFTSIADPQKNDTVGLSGSHNQIGLFYATTTPFIMMLNPALAIINILAVFLSTTTSAWLAFLVSGTLFAVMANKKILIYFVLFIVSSSIIFIKYYDAPNARKLNERHDLILSSIRDVERGYAEMNADGHKMKIKCNRWLGFGLGNFIRISPYTQAEFIQKNVDRVGGGEYPQHVYEHVHNDAVEVWYELGRLGFIAVLALVASFIQGFIASPKTPLLIMSFCAVISHLVSSLGIYTVQTAISGMILMIFYAVYVGEYNDINLKGEKA